MNKIDFRKESKHLYSPSAKEPALVEVPEMQFLMIDGKGDPNNSEEFQSAAEALYGIAYTIKFSAKKSGTARPDYVVPPLEGQWWMKGGKRFDLKSRDDWRWTLMIRQPDFVTEKDFSAAVSLAMVKKPSPALRKLRFERLTEGRCVQIMHIGPYAAEVPTVERMHAYAREQGLSLHGKHHEIYLGDPRRTAPERLKTVLRHPVR